MYIKQLASWDDSSWDRYFLSYNIVDKNERSMLRHILSQDKEYIELNFSILREFWIINGIWPDWFQAWQRGIITRLFPYVRYEWHDLMYGIGWVKDDKIAADKWLWKYTKKSILNLFTKLVQLEVWIIQKSLFILIQLVFLPIHLAIGYLFYIMVLYLGRKSFRWDTRNRRVDRINTMLSV